MAAHVRSAELLQRIAELVGVDVGAFQALNSADAVARPGDDPSPQHSGTVQLLRLVRMFRALPSDETRLQALQILDAFGSRVSDRTNGTDAV